MRTTVLAGVVASVFASFAGAPPALAADSIRYVWTYGVSSNGDTSCTDAAFTSIQAAVDDVPAGGTVIVCYGRPYRESVTIGKPLTLSGNEGAEIDAAGQAAGYAVGVAASNVTVEGLRLVHASGDGLAVLHTPPPPGKYAANAGNVTVTDDWFANNQHTGINLDGTYNAVVTGNRVWGNRAGILLSSRTAMSEHNLIAGNHVVGNRTGPGIHLADVTDHVADNRITGNVVTNNGYQGHGAGIMFSMSRDGAGISSTTVSGNTVTHNSLAGVVVDVPELDYPPYWHANVALRTCGGAERDTPGRGGCVR